MFLLWLRQLMSCLWGVVMTRLCWRERLRAAHARAAETCASQLGFDAVLVEPREIVPDAAASGACGCRLACRLAC